jgi:hypothetical protein
VASFITTGLLWAWSAGMLAAIIAVTMVAASAMQLPDFIYSSSRTIPWQCNITALAREYGPTKVVPISKLHRLHNCAKGWRCLLLCRFYGASGEDYIHRRGKPSDGAPHATAA